MEEDYNSYDEPKVCNHYTYGDDKLKLREDSFRDKNLITTPGWIVKDMLGLLPDSVWNTETTFLIPCIKSGNFAIEVKNRLMKCQDALEKFPDPVDRRNHIDSKQLFCIYWYTEEEFNKNLISGHIWGVTGFLEALCSPSVNFMCTDDLNFDTFKDKTGKKQEKLLESIKEKFGTVKFDVVIGNPPYNNDLYIDFVQWGHQRANKYSLWITPAKWQAKGGDKNERFRQTIVPHMSKIVYYKHSTDVFDIQEWGGISYFVVNKENLQNSRLIKNVCCNNNTYNSDWESHKCNDIRLFSNKINSIIDKIDSNKLNLEAFKQSLFVKNTDSGSIKTSDADIAIMQGENIVGYRKKHELFITDNLDKYKCIINVMTGGCLTPNNNGEVVGITKISIIKPNQVPKGSFIVLRYFNSSEECKSFISYCNTKLVNFLYIIGACGSTLTQEFFRFVPDPGAFDHTFTDEELYNKYSLTQDEINLIESVIKERK